MILASLGALLLVQSRSKLSFTSFFSIFTSTKSSISLAASQQIHPTTSERQAYRVFSPVGE
jgi:hypothetical protein